MSNARIRGSALQHVNTKTGEKQNELKRGDVLFNGSSETPEEVALGSYIDFDPGPRVHLNSFCFGYRINKTKSIDPRYLAYFFRSELGRNAVSSLAQGATRYNISKTKLMSIPLPLASYSKQKIVADILNDCDDLIEGLQGLIAKKRDVKQGMMQELLTGRTRLPGFAGEWREVQLGQLGSFLKGRGIKRDQVRPSGVPCIRYGELYTVYRDYAAEVVSFVDPYVAATALPIVPGDLLFAGSGETKAEIGITVAYVGKPGAIAGGDIIVLRGSGYDPVFLATLLNTPVVASQKASFGQGDAVVHIGASALSELHFRVPSFEEQHAIGEVLRDVDAEIRVLERRLELARDVKVGMMQELLTGRTRLPIEEES